MQGIGHISEVRLSYLIVTGFELSDLELIILRDILIHRFGQPFLRWVDDHPDNCLSPQVGLCPDNSIHYLQFL